MSQPNDVVDTPVKTTLSNAAKWSLLVIGATSVYIATLVSDRRDHSEFRANNAQTSQILSTVSAQQAKNTIDLAVLVAESKKNEEIHAQTQEENERIHMEILRRIDDALGRL